MRGTITINDKQIDMVANGATPVLYKRVFRKDFLVATQNEDMDSFSELAYIMAAQAEKPISELINSLTYDKYIEWVSEFEALDLVNHAAEIFGIYQAQTKTTSVAKKKK